MLIFQIKHILLQFVMSSQVWKRFEVDVGNPNKAVCNLCDISTQSQVIQGGKTLILYSTNPLWNHHKNSCKSSHDKLVKTHEDDPQAEDSSTGQHSSQSQLTLSQFINQKKTWNPKSVQSKKITRIIGNFQINLFLH